MPDPMPDQTGCLFCFGLGYSAAALAAALPGRAWRIAGTGRTAESAGALARRGIGAQVFTGDAPMADAASVLAPATHLLLSIPPGADGDPALRHHGGDIAALKALRWVGYFSTTGVYGDRGGAWVDEATPPEPTGERGRFRLEAETGWLDLWRRLGVPVHVFRLAGIYGPGRSVLDQLRAGTARRIDKPGQVFSRVHVDDLARVLMASMASPRPGAIYNVCDDEPAPPAEVVSEAARLLRLEPPPLVPLAQAGLGALGLSFFAENKRVSNARIKRELGVSLRYPNYRQGLAALARDQG